MYPILTFTIIHLAAAVSASCPRTFLRTATDAYILAQQAGAPNTFTSYTAPNATYTENALPLSITAGVLSHPIHIDYTFSAHDTVQCASFTELVAASDPHPYVIHTRMEFENEKATLVESVVTDAGDWAFNATGTLALLAPEIWSPIPAPQRDARAAIRAIGDAYFDRFGNTSVAVPWGPPCYRVEGGLAARGRLRGGAGGNGTDAQCEMAWPSTIIVPYRRYVVDEEVGVVDVFVGFPGLDRSQGQRAMPDSHLFRVEGGRVRYVHTASSCVVAGCGMNGTMV